MSYTPTNWKDGDLVTSAKLNKIEQGIAENGVMIVELNGEYLNKTGQELLNTVENGTLTFLKETHEDYTEYSLLTRLSYYSDQDAFAVQFTSSSYHSHLNEYPVLDD